MLQRLPYLEQHAGTDAALLAPCVMGWEGRTLHLLEPSVDEEEEEQEESDEWQHGD